MVCCSFGGHSTPQFLQCVHDIARSLGPNKSIAVTMFYVYTGCHTVSSFGTKGKKTTWIIRMNNEEVIPTFLALPAGPAHIKMVI